MDLFVELPDGTSKHVPVSLNCSVRAATQSCVLRAGMTAIASKLTEFSLAKKTDNQNPLIDVCWLDEGLRVKDQGGEDGSLNLILLKKYYTTNADLGLLGSCGALLKTLYSQFRRAYVSGLCRCTQSEAAQLSSLIARAEFSLSELRPGSLQKTGRLESIVPSHHLTSKEMEQEILKALGSVTYLTESKAQERFVDLLSTLDTFGLSMHTITLVEIGGVRREALLGVGPQTISVMEAHNLKTLMQWKTKDLAQHSFNDTTFSMICGSENITMVTKQGHMISAFLSGMMEQQTSSSSSPPKKPLRPQRSLALMENGHASEESLSDRTSYTHIKTVGKQVERYEVELKKSRPLPRPSPRGQPPARPTHPPRARHAPLRGTQSVPIRPHARTPAPLGPPPPRPLPAAGRAEGHSVVYEVPLQKPRQSGAGEKTDVKSSPAHVWKIDENRVKTREGEPLQLVTKIREVYEAPFAKSTGRTEVKRKLPDLPNFEEARYETSDIIEEEPPQSVLATKPRPLLPPVPQGRKPHLKNPIPSHEELVDPSLKKTHKSESDLPLENGREDPHEYPIYDQLVPSPDYTKPEVQTPSPSCGRPSPREKPVSNSPNPFSPPPPSSPAPPPPDTSDRVPHVSSAHAPPPPRTPAPEPPIYDTLTPEDDMREVEDVFGSKDLPMRVKYSCNTNPIYDTLAATKVRTSLTVSQVTYHSFTNTLERQLKQKRKLPKSLSQPQVVSSSSSSSPPVPPSPHDYETSELLSLLMKDISPRESPTPGQDSVPLPSETGRGEKPRKKTPPPLKKAPLTKTKSAAQITSEGKSNERSSPRHLPVKTTTPSAGYSRLEHFKNRPSGPRPPLAEPKSGSASDEDEHEYAEVDHNAPRKTKVGQKKPSALEKAGWVTVQSDVSTPPPIPPLRGSEWEGKKLGPPKPPRARQRWEKKVDKGPEGKSHKAVKNTDALRDYSTLMQEFRMFHVKLPTGIIHTDMANVRSEVGKLVKRLCVLLCVDETECDHYSLYVEGTPHTLLPEMLDEEGGGEESGMFRRLRQKSPSRQDLFGSKSFALQSERSNNPVLLDPALSFKSQGITTSRILALRPQTILPSRMTRFQIQVPDWVRFHQCWLSVVQGNLMTTQTEAVKLAALQYQAYFLDRTEFNSVIGFCRSSDFLPLNFANAKGIEEKVYAEQQRLKGYTRLHSQDSYIFTACSLPTFNTIFFLGQEAKRKILHKNTKLAPVLIGINKVGVVRADYKTKEILDTWPYQVLKNWGYTEHTFILEFDDRTYPVKTAQGRWMNAIVDFHIETILGDMTTPPVTHQEMGGARTGEEVVPVPHNRDNVDEIYSDLLSVRAQAQQWLASEAANGRLPSSSSSPPSSPPTPHQPHTHTTQQSPTNNQRLSTVHEPADYEEVEFPPPTTNHHCIGVYDVLRKECQYEEEDDAIYDVPPDT